MLKNPPKTPKPNIRSIPAPWNGKTACKTRASHPPKTKLIKSSAKIVEARGGVGGGGGVGEPSTADCPPHRWGGAGEMLLNTYPYYEFVLTGRETEQYNEFELCDHG